MRKILLLSLVVFTSLTSFGQDFSNKGKQFWFCFPSHVPSGSNLGRLQVWITSDQASSGTVSVTNGSFSAPFTVGANSITSVEIPYVNAHISNAESGTVLQKSIKLQVNPGQPSVVAYLQQFAAARSAATLLLPTSVLGRKYLTTSFFQNGTGRSQFQIIATKPNTNVVITPRNNGAVQPVINLTLPNVGDMYQYQSTQDISGSLIESVAGGMGECNEIAVFSGSSGTSFAISGCNAGNSVDPLMQQLYPITTWGKNFGFIPFGDYPNGNPYRIMAAEDNTTVSINGAVVAILNAGDIFPNNYGSANPVTLTVPTSITADKQIAVSQYCQRNPCSGSGHGDPDMVILNPIEQNIKDITIFTSTQEFINRQWINVLIPTVSAPSFKIDGLAPTTPFQVAANIPGYSYLTHRFTTPLNGARVITADTGFNAICYGFEAGAFESYAYSAGTNVRDLTKSLEIETTYGIETSPSVCTNSPFKFKVYFPDSTIGTPTTPPVAIRFDSLKWDLSNPSLIVPNNFPIMVYGTVGSPPKVAIDSINIRAGRSVAWYSLPTTYFFNAPGIDTLLITGYTSTNEGCGSNKEYEFAIQISDPPTASFDAPVPGCYLEPVVATETTPQIPKPTYKMWWEFYDPVTNITTVYSGTGSAFKTATHTFTTPGVKRIRHASITTPGCLSDTIVQNITLPDIPTASIAGATAVCVNAASPTVTFTGSLGTAEYVFTYNINGGAPITTPPSVGGIATVLAPTTTAGTFRYNLTGVSNASPAGTPCVRALSNVFVDVIVNPLPNAAISGGTTVCLNATPPTVTFTGSNATAPYTFDYTINGVPQTPIVSNAAGIATVTAPTNASGTFVYEITQVTDASSTTCNSIITGTTTTITVQDLPIAAIASSSTAVCQNATQPTITFTGSGGTAPYTFNYTINSVAQAPVVSNAAGIATLNVPTTTVGSYVYEITQVTEGSPQACLRAITGQTITVDVNPLPNAAIAGAVTVCLNSLPEPVVTFTGSNSTAPYTFEYTINGVPQTPVVSNAAGIAMVNAPTTVVGTFVYAITQVTDGSSTACVRPISGTSTTITIQDLPNGVIAGSATSACLNSAPPPTITFTGSTGTAPYTFTYMINGVTQPTVVSNAAGVATINVPTNVATTYTYELTAVSEASAQVCSRTITGQTWIVVINPLPTGVITGTPEVCRNDPSPFVTFTGSGATAPYTFSYTINGTPQPPVVSNAAGIATVAVPTTVAGTFTYVLTSVQDASSTSCSQVIAGQQTVVTVNQLPTAAFTYTAPSCETRVINFTDGSAPNSGNLNSWTWDFGDGPPTSPLQNPTHIYAAAGVYNVTLTVTTDKGCTSDPIANIPVNIDNRPQAGFIIPEVCLSDTYAQFFDTSKLTNAVIDRWDWDFGDPNATPGNPNTSNVKNPTHSYTATGNYNVRLIVWNSVKGCRDTITQVLQVNGSFPTANFSVNNPTTLCANDSVAVVEASTVFPGNITKVEIWFDNVASGPPAAPDILDNFPVTGKVYKHLYPNFQSPLTRTFQIRYRAYSGGVCLDDSIRNITVNAAPLVQFNNMPDVCYLANPFQITQASEIGGVPGTGVFSGPGVSTTGIFTPTVAGIGTHTILYTFTSTAAGCVDTMSNTITVLDTAHAVFGVTLPSCEQTPTLFTNQSTAPASVSLISTVWDFGDATGPQTFLIADPISHIYANPSPPSYTVTMHTVDNNGCLSTDTTAVITIDANHDIQWDATSGSENQALCVNTALVPIRYTLSGGATNVSIPGLPAGLTYTVSGSPLTLTISGAPTVPANYSFNIQTTGNTCTFDNANVIISVAPDHTISLLSGDTAQSVCLNTPIDDIFYDLGGGATGVNITGLPNGVTYTVTGNTVRIFGTPTNIPLSGPGYTINTTGNTCVRDSRTGEIVVHDYPVPSFTVDKPGYCIPNAIVAFTNTTTPAPVTSNTYVWDFGDGSPTVTSVSPTHWYTSGVGPFTVRLSATSVVTPILNNGQPGCNSFIDVPMTTIHPQPKADFVFSKPSVCIGDNVTITDNTDGKDGIVNQWNWDLGDGTTRVINPLTHTYGDTITYNITMYSINTHGCNSDTLTKPFTVYPYPKVNAGQDKFVLEGGSVELEATAYGREPIYTWTPVDYLTDSKILRPRVTNPKTDMTYRLTVTGKGGCALSDDVFVKLLKFPVIPNTFTPNGDGINDTWRIDFLNTYPNNRVQIFTRTGKIVFESRGYNTPWDGSIKGKPLPFDTYYYIIEPGNGRDPITGYVTILK